VGYSVQDSFAVYLIKTNAQGETLWARTYGGTGYDGGGSVQQTSDSGYIVVGWTSSFGAGAPDSCNVYLIVQQALYCNQSGIISLEGHI
jgi:hypothetical protein